MPFEASQRTSLEVTSPSFSAFPGVERAPYYILLEPWIAPPPGESSSTVEI